MAEGNGEVDEVDDGELHLQGECEVSWLMGQVTFAAKGNSDAVYLMYAHFVDWVSEQVRKAKDDAAVLGAIIGANKAH